MQLASVRSPKNFEAFEAMQLANVRSPKMNKEFRFFLFRGGVIIACTTP